MESFRIEIINPKAKSLIKSLVDMDLIRTFRVLNYNLKNI